ncbi:MAG TPA: ABC transporter ATP-binding protein [Syntrophorhabdaceae bacterium]|nr:ABC transporter ATP-binding protein [Syntrophorhabdaceae bacterium]
MEEPILNVERVSYRYHDTIPALLNVSLSLKQGEKFALIGTNGSGKSTLLRVMSGLLLPDSGRIFFKGREVTERSLRQRGFLKFFRAGVGYIFQDPDVQLFSPTVLDELVFGPMQLGIPHVEALERAQAVIKMLHIEALTKRPPYMLSEGEKKKVAVGSVLTMNPEVLLLDEPTGGLDPRTQCFLTELIFELNEAGKTILVSTHDLTLVDELQPTVGVLSEEHTIERVGAADAILGDEDLLLRVNLIHEHMHYHGVLAHAHRHSHYLYHRH